MGKCRLKMESLEKMFVKDTGGRVNFNTRALSTLNFDRDQSTC